MYNKNLFDGIHCEILKMHKTIERLEDEIARLKGIPEEQILKDKVDNIYISPIGIKK